MTAPMTTEQITHAIREHMVHAARERFEASLYPAGTARRLFHMNSAHASRDAARNLRQRLTAGETK